MKKIISLFLVFFLLGTSLEAVGADEKTTYRSVLKIRTYEYNSTNNTYSISQMGSAVVIGTGLLLTNAHVVFNSSKGVPDGFYEVCRTIDFRKKAVCFTSGELIAFDEANDLALLRFRQPSDLPVAPLFQEDLINIGAKVIIYGYPEIGGENISRTEGNVAGYEEPFYKIDGAIDHGNSGGGAFNKYGEFLGVPSRVSSDNAVIGYMLPISTIREFLNKKSKGYTSISLKAPEDFKKFIKNSQIGERSNDIISDANTKTLSLKKFGLTLLGKIEGVGSFLYGMSMNNLAGSSLYFGCYKIGGALSSLELDERSMGEGIKKYKVSDAKIGNNGQYAVRTFSSLIASEGRDAVQIYDTINTCDASINKVSLQKDKKAIDQAVAFITSAITLKKTYPMTSGFDTQLFHIERLPTGISVRETPRMSGESSIEVGYFSPAANTGETMSEIYQNQKDTLDNYFLGGKNYFDDSPSDPNLKPEEYSFETFRKLYEKKYTKKGYSDTSIVINESKNKKKYVLVTADYKDPDYNEDPTSSIIVFSYPYYTMKGDKKEYYQLTYMNSYEGGNAEAITKLKDFFANLELIGSAPF